MIIKATATIEYQFDTEDGFLSTKDEAISEVLSMLYSGDIGLDEWDVTAEEVKQDA